MANVIFYFTGTGNSLTVARDIAEKLGDTKLVPIGDAAAGESMETDYERIGFVFPVYFVCVPAIVRRFVSRLKLRADQYVFGVATFGGTCGTTLSQLGRSVAASGGSLDAGFYVRMPGNYIVKYGAYPSAIQNLIIRGEKKRISGIAEAIREKRAVRIPRGSIIFVRMEDSYRKIADSLGGMADNFHTTGKCSGCGICQKLCPVDNIRISEKRPMWGDSCEQCMACIQWCPAQAIEYGDKTQKRRRYRNPEVNVKSLIND